jgi:hypothetical protein
MDEDNTSPEAVETTVENPEADLIMDTLNDTEDTSEAKAEPEVVETPEEEVTAEETEPEVEQPEEDTTEVEPVVDPKEEARRRYEDRQAAREQSQQRVQEVNQKHISGAEDEYDQRLRTMEADNYSRTVEHNENTLVGEFDRAKSNPDLQIFNPDNKDAFNQKAYDKAMRDYNAGYVTYDDNQNIVGLKGSLYEHLNETAELFQGATKSGAVQQVRASRKMQTKADSKPAADPRPTAKDPILEMLLSD